MHSHCIKQDYNKDNLHPPCVQQYVAKCNLHKVNLELMLPAVSPSLHMIRGGAPLEFAGANYVQPCLLAIVAITASVSESLRIH